MNMQINTRVDVSNLYLTPYESLKEVSKKQAENIAYSYFKTNVTYKKLLNQVDDVAKSFSKLNIKPGDVVTICAPNIPEFLISFYALNKLGATVNLVYHLSSENLFEESLIRTKTKILLVNRTTYLNFKKILEKINLEKIIVISTRKSMDKLTKLHYKTIKIESKSIDYNKKVINWDKFLHIGKSSSDVVLNSDLDAKTLITYDYTNSKELKPIVHSNKNIQSSIRIQENLFDLPKQLITLGIIPFSDGHGLIALHTTLLNGGKFLIVPYFDIEDFIKIIKKDKPTVIIGLITFYESLLDIIIKGHDLSHFKLVICEGEIINSKQEENINNFLKKHNAAKLTTTYSLPETLSIITKTKSSNNIINVSEGVQIKIVKPETTINQEINKIGQLCIYSPNMMQEYLNDPIKTKKALQKHDDQKIWLHTKNQGYVNADGKISLVTQEDKKASYVLSSQYPGQKIMGNKFYTFMRVFMYLILRLLYNPVVLNPEKIPLQGSMILCGNHRHVFDQTIPMSRTSRNIHYLTKKEYFDSKYSFFFKLMGCISVNRQIKDNKATNSSLEMLRTGGAVGIFPEGTRNKTKDPLLPFKFGAVSMAKKTDALIVPFAISGKFKIGRNNKLIVSVGDPFKVDDDLEAANDYLKKVILDLLDKNKKYFDNKKIIHKKK